MATQTFEIGIIQCRKPGVPNCLMIIYQIANNELIAFQAKGGIPMPFEQKVMEQNAPQQEAILVLDYETYLNPAKRNDFFRKYPCTKEIPTICSPHEAMGGYFQHISPTHEGDLSVVDFQSGNWYAYKISFSEGCYQLKSDVTNCKKIRLSQSNEKILNLSDEQLLDFEKFLGLEADDGKRYGQIIKEALIEFEKGAKEYDDIIAIFDIHEWAHIKMCNLVEFRTQIFSSLEIGPSMPTMMTGWIGFLFTKQESLPNGMEKVYGAMHLVKNRPQFYNRLETEISLGVFCYPDLIKIPVFAAQSAYPDYSVPKSLVLIDTGSIEIYRGEESLSIKTGKTLERIQLEISLDGNQNMLLVAGKETHLIA